MMRRLVGWGEVGLVGGWLGGGGVEAGDVLGGYVDG